MDGPVGGPHSHVAPTPQQIEWQVNGLDPSPCPASTCLRDLFQVTWHLWASDLSLDLPGVLPFRFKSPMSSEYSILFSTARDFAIE